MILQSTKCKNFKNEVIEVSVNGRTNEFPVYFNNIHEYPSTYIPGNTNISIYLIEFTVLDINDIKNIDNHKVVWTKPAPRRLPFLTERDYEYKYPTNITGITINMYDKNKKFIFSEVLTGICGMTIDKNKKTVLIKYRHRTNRLYGLGPVE